MLEEKQELEIGDSDFRVPIRNMLIGKLCPRTVIDPALTNYVPGDPESCDAENFTCDNKLVDPETGACYCRNNYKLEECPILQGIVKYVARMDRKK